MSCLVLINKQPTVYECCVGRVQVKPTGAKKAAVKQPVSGVVAITHRAARDSPRAHWCPCWRLHARMQADASQHAPTTPAIRTCQPGS
jgi:hypothetical protein